MNAWRIKQAVRTLNHGGVIAYPTEAVWGLGCDPWNRAAVMRLLALKRRPVEKGLILIAGSLDQVEALVRPLKKEERRRLQESWPGPVTWLLPDPKGLVPDWIKGDHKSVAVRVSDHPLVAALCRELRTPLVSTSANRAGQLPARSSRDVRLAMGHQLDYLLPGALGGLSRPTEIRDLNTLSTLRF